MTTNASGEVTVDNGIVQFTFDANNTNEDAQAVLITNNQMPTMHLNLTNENIDSSSIEWKITIHYTNQRRENVNGGFTNANCEYQPDGGFYANTESETNCFIVRGNNTNVDFGDKLRGGFVSLAVSYRQEGVMMNSRINNIMRIKSTNLSTSEIRDYLSRNIDDKDFSIKTLPVIYLLT